MKLFCTKTGVYISCPEKRVYRVCGLKPLSCGMVLIHEKYVAPLAPAKVGYIVKEHRIGAPGLEALVIETQHSVYVGRPVL